MNEKEWADSIRPHLMLKSRGARLSPRKLRLFAVGCCREVWNKFSDQGDRVFIELYEQYVEGHVQVGDWQLARTEALSSVTHRPGYDLTRLIIRSLASEDLVESAIRCSEHAAFLSVVPSIDEASLDALDNSGLEAVRLRASEHASLLRCIAGTRYRLPKLNPAWLTSDVRALAAGIYDDRAFDRMPILADALQDAGCDRDDVLSHCRGAGPHVRGCWVIDLLLGKE